MVETMEGCNVCEAKRLRDVDDVRLALEAIMDGAATLDAEALIDQLSDRGLTVVRT